MSHQEFGQLRSYVHENFEKFKIILTPTGSWIRSRLRRDRIQLPVGVKIILNFSKFSWTYERNCPHSRWDTVALATFIVKFFRHLSAPLTCSAEVSDELKTGRSYTLNPLWVWTDSYISWKFRKKFKMMSTSDGQLDSIGSNPTARQRRRIWWQNFHATTEMELSTATLSVGSTYNSFEVH